MLKMGGQSQKGQWAMHPVMSSRGSPGRYEEPLGRAKLFIHMPAPTHTGHRYPSFKAFEQLNIQYRSGSTPAQVTFSDKGTSFSLAYGDAPIDYYDEAGRLIGTFHQEPGTSGVHYRRGLDNRLVEKYRTPDQEQHVRQSVGGAEKRRIIGEAYDRARALLDDLRAGRVEAPRSLDLSPVPADAWDRVANRIESAVSWQYEDLAADTERFSRVFAPVSILPPDQYMALVVQVTVGCSYNRCTFCDFYKDRQFHVKTPDELRSHVVGVLDFMGRSVTLRRSVFLADGNALVIPQPKLLERLDVLDEFFTFPPAEVGLPGRPSAQRTKWLREHPGSMEGTYSFLDGFSSLKKSPADFAELKTRGLRRVYVGLESGSDEVLRFVRKPGDAAGTVDAVRTIKEGGVAVGVIIMVGVGGATYEAEHVARTLEAVNSMGLDAGDIVYLSDFVNHPGLPYEQLAEEAGVRDLTFPEMTAQTDRLKRGFVWSDPSSKPKVAPYDIREFVY